MEFGFNTSVLPASEVRDPRVYLDADVATRHEGPHHCDRREMFFGAATDTQCAAFRTTPRFADPDSVSRGQQCGLLQLGPSRCVWPSSRPAAVSSQCRRSTDLLGEEVRTRNTSALRTPLITICLKSAWFDNSPNFLS